MIVDTSAIIAIAQGEPERAAFLDLLMTNDVAMSTATYLECGIVLDSRHETLGAVLDELVATAEIELVPVTVEQAKLARLAYRAFGKGHHKAALNVGDCLSYALAEQRGERLLYKGDDFAATGLPPL